MVDGEVLDDGGMNFDGRGGALDNAADAEAADERIRAAAETGEVDAVEAAVTELEDDAMTAGNSAAGLPKNFSDVFTSLKTAIESGDDDKIGQAYQNLSKAVNTLDPGTRDRLLAGLSKASDAADAAATTDENAEAAAQANAASGAIEEAARGSVNSDGAKTIENATKSNPGDTRGRYFKSLLCLAKIGTIFAMMIFIVHWFSQDTGCWEYQGGAKTRKLNLGFPFNSTNAGYCTCSANSAMSTAEPVETWCSSAMEAAGKSQIESGDEWYVTCPPYKETACNVSPTNPDGIFYSYYISSPIGIWNSACNQLSKAGKGAGNSILTIVKYGIIIICIFISLFFVYKSITEKQLLYLIGILPTAGVGVGGYLIVDKLKF